MPSLNSGAFGLSRVGIEKILTEQREQNRELLNSSRNKDIVAFLGETGAGKSTLIE